MAGVGVDTGSWVDGARQGCSSGCAPSCSNSAPHDPARLVFDPDTGRSSVITIGSRPVMVHNVRNYAGSALAFEMLYGSGSAEIAASLSTPAGALGELTAPGSARVLCLPGRYRLQGVPGSVDADDLCVIVSEIDAPLGDFLSMMVG